MRLSRREWVLVTVLAVLLIWTLGGGRVLEAAAERRLAAYREYRELQLEMEDVERFAASYGEVEARPVISDEEDFFCEAVDSVALDRMFQRMAGESGLTARSMEIVKPEPIDEEPETANPGLADPELAIERIRVHLELTGPDIKAAVEMAGRINRESENMAVSRMEVLREDRRKASEAEASAGVICRMDVDIYCLKPQAAKKDGETATWKMD